MSSRLEFDMYETCDHKEFVNSVQRFLNDGWQLHGHLIAFPDSVDNIGMQRVRYIQSFTRLKTDKSKINVSGASLLDNYDE